MSLPDFEKWAERVLEEARGGPITAVHPKRTAQLLAVALRAAFDAGVEAQSTTKLSNPKMLARVERLLVELCDPLDWIYRNKIRYNRFRTLLGETEDILRDAGIKIPKEGETLRRDE